jgi:glycosyltransferase involved in cell wall biosynthesis
MLGFFNVTPFKQLLLGFSAFLRLSTWSLCRIGKPRVILAYNLTVPPGIFVWAAARLTGSRICGALIDIEVPGATVPDTYFFKWDLQIHRFLIPRLDGRVVVADAIQEDFAPGLPCLRIEGGVGEPLVQFTRQELNIINPADPFRMVAVGKLDATNGFDLMLGAMQQMAGESVTLDIAGAGPLAQIIEEDARRDSRITVHGFLDLEKVLALYRQADLILVIRKTQEGHTRYFFPGKLFEALLSAVPVLATNTGHLREEFGAYLYVLEDETAEGLASRIRNIRAVPVEGRRGLGARARAFIIREKHWRSQCRKIRDLLEGLF